MRAERTEFEAKEVFWPALVEEWRLTPVMKAAFDRRESADPEGGYPRERGRRRCSDGKQRIEM